MNLVKFGVAAACILAIGVTFAGCARQNSDSAGTTQLATVAIAPAPAIAPASGGRPVAAVAATDSLPVIVVSAARTPLNPIVLSERSARTGKY